MILGYARTLTTEQVAGLAAQERDLRAAGVQRIFAERTSAIGVRGQLDAALDYLRDGDVLVVTKIDRLARSVADLCAIVAKIDRKSASLWILSMNLDTGSPTGRLMFNVIGSVAQFEREIMLERQREGVAKAKAAGRYKGRAPTARAKSAEIRGLAAQGLTREAIAAQLKIGVASVYRVLRAKPREQPALPLMALGGPS